MIVDMNSVVKLSIVSKLYDMYKDVIGSKKAFDEILLKCIEQLKEEFGNDIDNLSLLEDRLKITFNVVMNNKLGMIILDGVSYPNDGEVKVLMERINSGDMDARKEMAERNLGLVFKFAAYYDGLCWGLDFDDLVVEGSFGLMKAIDKFDITLGYKFSTYASYWILQYIKRRLCNADRVIKLPIYLAEQIKSYNCIYRQLELKLGRTPSEEEVAKELKIDVSRVRKLVDIKYKYDGVISLNQEIKAIDEEDYSKSDTEYGSFVADERVNLEDVVINNQLAEILAKSLELLTDREREIIVLRFGLNGDGPMTLTDIGERYGVTYEAVRQRQEKALRKIRNSRYRRSLREYL